MLVSAPMKMQATSSPSFPESPLAPATSLREVAKLCDAEIVGDADLKVTRIVHPEDAEGPHDLAIAMDPAILPLLEGSRAVAAVIARGQPAPKPLAATLVIEHPRRAMAALTNHFVEKNIPAPGKHPTAVIAPDAQIDPSATIGPYVIIEAGARIGPRTRLGPQVYIGHGAQLGADGLLHSGVKVMARVHIGDRVQIHANAIIGADGFSFVTPELGSIDTARATGEVTALNGDWLRIASLGAVIIEDDVEIGAGTAIDRGTLRSTRICRGSKIDNLVQIGHNVMIGENVLICGQAGIAGSVQIGDRVVVGGGVGIADHRKIGKDAVLLARAGVATNVPPRGVFGGYPAMDYKRFRASYMAFQRLGRLTARLEEKLGLAPVPAEANEKEGEE